jgi:hypothetical protein
MDAAFGSDRTHIIDLGYVLSFSHWALHQDLDSESPELFVILFA